MDAKFTGFFCSHLCISVSTNMTFVIIWNTHLDKDGCIDGHLERDYWKTLLLCESGIPLFLNRTIDSNKASFTPKTSSRQEEMKHSSNNMSDRSCSKSLNLGVKTNMEHTQPINNSSDV